MAQRATDNTDSADRNTNRRKAVKQGNKWFNILTTAWAIALVLVTVLWVTQPAFARGGFGGDDCSDFCIELKLCGDDGCMPSPPVSGGYCGGDCRGGGDWECWVNENV